MKTKKTLALVFALSLVSIPATFAASDDLAEMFKSAAEELGTDTSAVADTTVTEEKIVETDPMADVKAPEVVVTETTECNDGIDNDGDSAIDFGEDLGCTSATDTSEKDEEVAAPTAETATAPTKDALGALFSEEDFANEGTKTATAETGTVTATEAVATTEEQKLPEAGPELLGVFAVSAVAGYLARRRLAKKL